jgi:hypothetical protein
VRTTNDQAVAAGRVGVDPARWQVGLEELLGRVAGRFPRVKPRRHARAFARAAGGPATKALLDDRLVGVAGTCWRVQGRRSRAGKGLCGLDQHQVRRWRSWCRWVTLAMLADAFLVVAAVTEHARHPPPLGLIPLTCNEIQHLFATLAAAPTGHRLRWSMWRRRHQARARARHYRRQANGP